MSALVVSVGGDVIFRGPTLTSSGHLPPLKKISPVSDGGRSLVEFPEIPEGAALCCASQFSPISDQRDAETLHWLAADAAERGRK